MTTSQRPEPGAIESQVDDAPAIPALDAGIMPWGYGEDRITVLVRDPDSVYVYWEITDGGIERARDRLGPGGAGGWCNLRVYDTTNRDFDGTNANDYFDVGVDRTEREYFLMIRRPTSTMHVEIGIMSHEGYFQPIARSGRAVFPRNAPSPDTSLEWLTVTSGRESPAAAPYRSRYKGAEPSLPERAGAGYVDAWRAGYAASPESRGPAEHASSGTGGGSSWGGASESHVKVARSRHVEPWWHVEEWRVEWRGGLRFTQWSSAGEHPGTSSWESGPEPPRAYMAEMDERIGVELLDHSSIQLWDEGTRRTVYGPWLVTIHSAEGPRRRVLATWSMHWVTAQTPLILRWTRLVEGRATSTFRGDEGPLSVSMGASERRALFERGASEHAAMGASERASMGASEHAAMGASERGWIAASERIAPTGERWGGRGEPEREGDG